MKMKSPRLGKWLEPRRWCGILEIDEQWFSEYPPTRWLYTCPVSFWIELDHVGQIPMLHSSSSDTVFLYRNDALKNIKNQWGTFSSNNFINPIKKYGMRVTSNDFKAVQINLRVVDTFSLRRQSKKSRVQQ